MGMNTMQMHRVEQKRARQSAARRRGWPGRFPCHGQVAVDVFDFNGGVIDEDANCEREPAQRHDVDGLAEGAETQDADENGQRNRYGNNQRALPVAEEKQNHGGGEASGDDRFSITPWIEART